MIWIIMLIAVPVIFILLLVVASRGTSTPTTVQPTVTSQKITAGEVATGLAAATAIAGIAAWKLEGIILDRQIKRNRSKYWKLRGEGWGVYR